MTGTQKIEAAFSAEGTAEVPAVLCYESIYVRDHWDQLTRLPWWAGQGPDIETQLAWRRDFLHKTPQDWFRLPLCLSLRERGELRLEVELDGAYRVNRRTGQRQILHPPQVGGWDPRGQAASIHPANPPETPDQVDGAIPVEEDFDASEVARDGSGDLAARMLEEFGRDRTPLGHVSSPLYLCYQIWGFEGLMLRIATQGELVMHAARRNLRRMRQAVLREAAMGSRVVWIEECFLDMISPAYYAEMNVPLLRELTEEIRSRGMKSIFYHCGNPAGKLELLLSAGADALALEEGKKGFSIDIEDVAEAVAGRCTLLGNLDAMHLLPSATETQLRAQIARQIAAGRANRGRFIMSLGSPVTPGTSVERVRMYLNMAHELGTP